ncbi:MAG TPA: protein translocase subunit SecF [Vicinamibacterales bacterium]|nr:protein translocase subunit SecF [Vicinamibacterales bacterium]
MDLVRHKNLYFLISAILIIPGLISLVLPGGLRPGIDFTSGTILTVRFTQPVDQPSVRNAFSELGHTEAIVQAAGDNTFIIRTRPFTQVAAGASTDTKSERQVVEEGLRSRLGEFQILSLDLVSPLIAQEIVYKSVLAIGAACLAILGYLWWAFRKVPSPWRYGSAAVIALVHDALFVLGAFSILGRLFGIELDAIFIVAILTVIGFSVHDTIVVFDRIRENFIRHAGDSFEDVVNHSLTQTLARSLNTSLTVLLTLLALYLFGGVTIRNFVLALLIGITAGTYSSIFFASMMLVTWQRGDMGNWWARVRGRRPVRARAPI